MAYCTIRPPPKTARPDPVPKSLDGAWNEGSLAIVSSSLHKRHETQVDKLRKLDRERNYWWGMVYAFPAPAPSVLLKWSPKCKATIKGTGQPFVELYPPYLTSLTDLLHQPSLDFRLFAWLENVFDGLIVMSEEDLRLRFLTPDTLLLVAKDKHHPQPRFVVNVGCDAQPKDFLSPPEASTMSEEAFLDRFNELTPTSVSPRKRILTGDTQHETSQAYASFLLGMVLMAILRTSSLRYEKRDFYDDLSLLANDMTAFMPLRRTAPSVAKEQYLDLLASRDILAGLDLAKPPVTTRTRSKPPPSTTNPKRKTKKRSK